jgi:ubiquinone/menaquinone biosynthesis C-methylase UbiE
MQNTKNLISNGPHVCPHQCGFFLDNWIRRLIQPPARIIGPYIQEGDTVMDLGCGPGYFTIDMAKMVGPKGRVLAVDIQTKMLERVRKKATKHGVADRIEFHTAGMDGIGLDQNADFILAYYMIHEVPDMKHTLRELKTLLNSGGKILAVEPRMHVSQAGFKAMLGHAEELGLNAIDFPKKAGGRSVVWSA